jgi:peptidoglycan L-alanyl-D-glutamate endopeptidase CwlK
MGRLDQCDKRLQTIFQKVVEKFDCSVICGYRGKEEQEKAFDAGLSDKDWPNSKHNKKPSIAIDVAPFPINWKDIERFKALAYFTLGVAWDLGINLRWGADWNMNLEFRDEHFMDWGHFELLD